MERNGFDPMKVAIIGAGNVGKALVRLDTSWEI